MPCWLRRIVAPLVHLRHERGLRPTSANLNPFLRGRDEEWKRGVDWLRSETLRRQKRKTIKKKFVLPLGSPNFAGYEKVESRQGHSSLKEESRKKEFYVQSCCRLVNQTLVQRNSDCLFQTTSKLGEMHLWISSPPPEKECYWICCPPDFGNGPNKEGTGFTPDGAS